MLGGQEPAAQLPPTEEKKLVGHEETKMLEEASGQKIKELEDKLLRLAADFENYKKRSEKHNNMAKEAIAADSLRKLLPIVDDFGIAVRHIDKAHDKEFKHGMELIYAKLLDFLKREGVEEMKSLGERFDPYLHEAIRHEKGEEGKIVDVIQQGYLFRGKVLRHAKVVIGKQEV